MTLNDWFLTPRDTPEGQRGVRISTVGCQSCGAMVAYEFRHQHVAWHEALAQVMPQIHVEGPEGPIESGWPFDGSDEGA